MATSPPSSSPSASFSSPSLYPSSCSSCHSPPLLSSKSSQLRLPLYFPLLRATSSHPTMPRSFPTSFRQILPSLGEPHHPYWSLCIFPTI
ncbi:uncharacterized protein BO80DRAFT_423954 [Aspergillus ibericus CBS 121593]|uniref:Uncharacterized protein n=1 Tax=Aspergillus ibericus CBS 121593 TaxID=1448316 RepID=A0A395H2C1_9EURO|nr:hypothetical protein BO80DRAFT_423954 [Aspergillus ibericus CBS 121593]RAL02042.1 hypothetical protein BO80DRAFT_423954 [Aspergillus ibericus CBS 121593]